MAIRKLFLPISLLILFNLKNLYSATFEFDNSLQSGIEYDSNIFKTYDTSKDDLLLRALFKSSRDLKWSSANLALSYRLGGKKYFAHPEQDTMISFFELNFQKNLSEKMSLETTSNVKYQIENSNSDTEMLDINENFLHIQQAIAFKFSPGRGLSIAPSGEFYMLNFDSSDPTLSYYQQKYNLAFSKRISKPSEFGFTYSYNRYNFKNFARTDGLNEFTASFKYTGIIFASLGYTLQTNDSTEEAFSFTNHRISLITSIPVKFKRVRDDRTNLDPDLVLSLICILQFKHYPGEMSTDSEGKRFLLSESEEDNFNIIIFKITKSLTKNFATEFKYTRHSNEFALTGEEYRRSTYYIGVRFSF